MRRTSLFIGLAFLAGLGIGLFARSHAHPTPPKNGHSEDLAAIEKLHTADIECTLKQDPACLTALWSDDAINLGFPGPPVVGIKAIGQAFTKFRAEHPDFQVLKYTNDIKDVQIVDGWAIEVGYIDAAYKTSAKDSPVSFPRPQNMRVLKRQSDCSWKFALVGLQ